jgi:uncharacterized protein YdeI (YjbR/CyaY-like superfamily)
MGSLDETNWFEPSSRRDLRTWLEEQHASSSGVWVVYPRKAARVDEPDYDAIVEEALCFGWVDSRPGRVDDARTRVYLCPRRTGSPWAATNKARVEALVATGLMTPAGQAVIDRARADGSWSVIDSSEAAIVPDDLAKAFDDYPGSEQEFSSFPLGVRKQILQWIALAKRPATREARIDETARLAQQGRRANQWVPSEKRPPKS